MNKNSILLIIFLIFSFLSFGEEKSVFIDHPSEFTSEVESTLKPVLDFQDVIIRDFNQTKTQTTFRFNNWFYSLEHLPLQSDIFSKLQNKFFSKIVFQKNNFSFILPNKTGPPVALI